MSTGASSSPIPEDSTDSNDKEGLNLDSDREPATVSRTPDGQIAGVAVYLSADDLRSLGLPQDVEAVVPSIYKGTLVLHQVQAE